MSKKLNKNIVKFLSELGVSRRLQRSGPKVSGVKNSENVAEHVYRAAQIGYILAFLEGANPEKTAAMILFHDNGEIRVGDQHKVAKRYFNIEKAEEKAFKEQVKNLPDKLSQRITQLFNEFNRRKTKEAIVAKDADWLEAAITAKEYLERGYQGQIQWIKNVKKALNTDSAKQLLNLIVQENDFINVWWKKLKKLEN